MERKNWWTDEEVESLLNEASERWDEATRAEIGTLDAYEMFFDESAADGERIERLDLWRGRARKGPCQICGRPPKELRLITWSYALRIERRREIARSLRAGSLCPFEPVRSFNKGLLMGLLLEVPEIDLCTGEQLTDFQRLGMCRECALLSDEEALVIYSLSFYGQLTLKGKEEILPSLLSRADGRYLLRRVGYFEDPCEEAS